MGRVGQLLDHQGDRCRTEIHLGLFAANEQPTEFARRRDARWLIRQYDGRGLRPPLDQLQGFDEELPWVAPEQAAGETEGAESLT